MIIARTHACAWFTFEVATAYNYKYQCNHICNYKRHSSYEYNLRYA